MKKIIIAFTSLLLSNAALAQQEPHYTQNQFNSNLLINPAYAGSDPDNSAIGLRYRNQWTGMVGAPVTFGVIADTRINRLGIGLSYNYDKIGIEKISTPDLNISYQLPVGKKGTFATGFKLGYQSVTADFSALSNVNPSDPLYMSGGKLSIPYLGLGLLYYNPKFYLGLSSPRLFSFDHPTAPRTKVGVAHYYLYGGYRIALENGIEFRPALLLKYQAQAPLELDMSIDTWFKNTIGFGIGYRTGDAVTLMLKGQIKHVYMGYSYDLNTSHLNPYNGGSHEVFLGLKIPKKRKPVENDERNNNIRYF